MKHITFYLDFLSPYTWLAFERLPQELQGLSYSVSYQPVQPPRAAAAAARWPGARRWWPLTTHGFLPGCESSLHTWFCRASYGTPTRRVTARYRQNYGQNSP